MKYLHLVIWSPRNSFGGNETIIRTSSLEQKKMGHDVFVVGRIEGKKHKIFQTQLNGVQYVEIQNRGRRRPSSLAVGAIGLILLFWEILFSLFLLIPVVLKLVRREKIDVVIFYSIHLFCMSPLLRIWGVKTVLGLEVISSNPYPSVLSPVYWFRKIKYKFFNGVFTHTGKFYLPGGTVFDNLFLLKKYAGSLPVSYIPWGINVEKTKEAAKSKSTANFKKNNYDKIVICTSRLVEEKGVRYLLEAVPYVLDKFANTLFVFAGDGILRNYLEKRSKELKIEKNVLFTGFLPHQETLVVIKQSNLIVIPSSSFETFGIAFLEAYALKTPIVTTRFGGIPNVVHDQKTGILIPPGNIEKLQEAIIYLLGHKDEAQRLTDEGYRLVYKEYQLKTALKKLDTFLEKLVKNGI